MTNARRLLRTGLVLSGLMVEGCAMTPPPQPPPAPAPVVANIRVIVEVKPAAPLPQAGLARTAAIAKAQNQFIATLPAGRASVVQRYTNLPMLALQIDPAVADDLRRSPLVASVQPDEERKLQ